MRRLIAVAVLALLTTGVPLAGSAAAQAQRQPGTVQFFVEENTSRAANGDTFTISTSEDGGSFSPTSKAADGEGEFTHRASDGTLKGTGTWVAEKLLSYHSFGPATADQTAEFGLPPGSEGGDAKLAVHLTPESGGAGFDAVLDVICLLGTPPPSAQEGVTLVVEKVGLNFNDIVEGDNLFVRS